MSDTTSPASKPTHWRRAIRPLVWWCIMVLLMFAYRTHERLSANTRISFDSTLAGKHLGYEASTTIDGMRASSGQRIPIGWHTLTITHPKTKSFSTNLFVWYGEHDLGQIALERAMGTMVIKATPEARRLEISGPEFSVTLTNTFGFTSTVPTDEYIVEATYQNWRQRETIEVLAGYTAPKIFAPKLGALRIEASTGDVIYQLRNEEGRKVVSGALPTTLVELPAGNYQLMAQHGQDQREMPAIVKQSTTNNFRIEFPEMTKVSQIPERPVRASVENLNPSEMQTPGTISKSLADTEDFKALENEPFTPKATLERQEHFNFYFDDLNRRHVNTTLFTDHELILTNSCGGFFVNAYDQFTKQEPVFAYKSLDMPENNVFVFQARQKVGLGYRECFLVGMQVDRKKTKVRWKVIEYDNSSIPQFFQRPNQPAMTDSAPASPVKLRSLTADMQTQAKEGIGIVLKKIENASSN